jgi:hypothetical protein
VDWSEKVVGRIRTRETCNGRRKRTPFKDALRIGTSLRRR